MKFEDWYNASEWREGDNPVAVASDAWDYQQGRIDKLVAVLTKHRFEQREDLNDRFCRKCGLYIADDVHIRSTGEAR